MLKTKVDTMDKRNSKTTLLNRISELERTVSSLNYKMEKVYAIGCNGINYVARANYQEREEKAINDLDAAYYDEICSDV